MIEILPKEKTAVLGTAELTLFTPFVSSYGKEIELKRSVNISYVNPKMLGSESLVPALDIEVKLSAPLLPAEAMEAGNLMTITVEDMSPVPDEWTLKDGVDKDLTSSACTNIVVFGTHSS